MLRPVAFLTCLLLASSPTLAQTGGAAAADISDIALPARGQASIPLGVTIVVKSIVRGEDAVVVNLVASFDSRRTNSVMLADAPTFLAFGEDQRFSLRQPVGNPDLRIANGQSMEGSLVFPGRLPLEVREMTLRFNDTRAADDTSAPGVNVPIQLPPVP